MDSLPARGLIIRRPWIDLILDGKKTWEMRSQPTNVRGRIALIEAGTGMIVGEAFLQNCYAALNLLDATYYQNYHQVINHQLLKKWKFPWVFESAKRYERPVSYMHPRGAVIWVDLGKVEIKNE